MVAEAVIAPTPLGDVRLKVRWRRGSHPWSHHDRIEGRKPIFQDALCRWYVCTFISPLGMNAVGTFLESFDGRGRTLGRTRRRKK